MAPKNSSALDWSDYLCDPDYGDPSLKEMMKMPLDSFDHRTLGLIADKSSLLELVVDSPGPFFLLIPDKGKKIKVIHSLFVVDAEAKSPSFIGVVGTKKNALFKAMSGKHLTRSMKHVNKTGFAPSPGSFDRVMSPDDFRTVEGNQDDDENTVARFPNCFLLHPSLFLVHLSSGKPSSPAELASEIVKTCRLGYTNIDSDRSEGKTTQALTDAYELLCFLWGLEKGLGQVVHLDDPPDIGSVDDEIELRSSGLRTWIKDFGKEGNQPPPPQEKEEVITPQEKTNEKVSKRVGAPEPYSDDPSWMDDSSVADSSEPPSPDRKKPKGSPGSAGKGLGKKRPDSPLARKPPHHKGRPKEPLADSPDELYSPRVASGGRSREGNDHRATTLTKASKDRNKAYHPHSDSLDTHHQDRRGGRNRRVIQTRSGEGGGEPDGDPSSSSSSSSSPPRHREKGNRRRRSKSSSSDRSSSYHDTDRSRYRRRRSRDQDRGGDPGRGGLSHSRSSSGSPRRSEGGDRRGRRGDEGRRPKSHGRSRGEGDHWGASLAISLAKLTEVQLAATRREESKKSMLARMSEEQADLFRLVSAKDWYDERPRLNSFTRKLVADKDLSKAIDTVSSHLRRWPGQVSPKQLAMFLSKGFAAQDIENCPGGFTVFMFRPKSSAFTRNPEEERNAIRAMFGDSKLDDESVKFFAKQDFFLAENLADLEEQLRTALDFLILLTSSRSIATDGYRYGLEFINTNRRAFLLAIKNRPKFCVEFPYVLDCVFQSFLNRLGRFYGRPDAIAKARKSLRSFQKDAIERTLSGFAYGSVPTLRLPAALTERDPELGHEKRQAKTPPVNPNKPTAGNAPNPAQKQDWWATNPGAEPSWLLPTGKAFNEFFNSKDPVLKKNLLAWPEVKHHSMSRKKPICVKYQAVGRCTASCSLAHQPPGQMSATTKAAASKRFAEIYAA